MGGVGWGGVERGGAVCGVVCGAICGAVCGVVWCVVWSVGCGVAWRGGVVAWWCVVWCGVMCTPA